jgi:two-component system, NtrC family, sensor kinase
MTTCVIDVLEESFTNDSGQLTTSQIRICTELIAGDRVIIRITDHGLGILEAIKVRLFDPFFSTKANSKVTDIELSISYHISKAIGTVALWNVFCSQEGVLNS